MTDIYNVNSGEKYWAFEYLKQNREQYIENNIHVIQVNYFKFGSLAIIFETVSFQLRFLSDKNVP